MSNWNLKILVANGVEVRKLADEGAERHRDAAHDERRELGELLRDERLREDVGDVVVGAVVAHRDLAGFNERVQVMVPEVDVLGAVVERLLLRELDCGEVVREERRGPSASERGAEVVNNKMTESYLFCCMGFTHIFSFHSGVTLRVVELAAGRDQVLVQVEHEASERAA